MFSKRNINKIVVCNILGVNIAVITIEEAVKYIKNNLENLKGKYICVSNVHTTIMSYEDEFYKKIQNSSIMALPDGAPLSIISKLRGFKDAERVTGPDLMTELFEISEDNKYKHYFLGSTEENLKYLNEKLKLKYSNLNIVGMYSPPFRKLTEAENNFIINDINNSKADYVWIGLGAPKQELWMYKNKDKVNALMIGVGAGFDYHSGIIKRAPIWMQKICLEWLYRLMQDPKRLFKRYFFTNIKFIYLNFLTVLNYNLKIRKR